MIQNTEKHQLVTSEKLGEKSNLNNLIAKILTDSFSVDQPTLLALLQIFSLRAVPEFLQVSSCHIFKSPQKPCIVTKITTFCDYLYENTKVLSICFPTVRKIKYKTFIMNQEMQGLYLSLPGTHFTLIWVKSCCSSTRVIFCNSHMCICAQGFNSIL